MNLTVQQEMYAKVIQKAWNDADFKQRLVDNPVDTLADFTGQRFDLPEGKTLVVRDQTNNPSIIYFDIPVEPNLDELELSEEELEMVAGGFSPSYLILAIAAYKLGETHREDPCG